MGTAKFTWSNVDDIVFDGDVEKYDPSQPRDSHGQWSAGRGAAVWMRNAEDRATIGPVPVERFKSDVQKWSDASDDGFYDDVKGTWEEGYPSEEALTFVAGVRQHTPKFEGGVLYRGMSTEEMESLQDGSTVLLTRPTSFTRSAGIAADFAGDFGTVVTADITRPKRARAHDIGSYTQEGSEVLVLPGERFRVAKRGGTVVLTQI